MPLRLPTWSPGEAWALGRFGIRAGEIDGLQRVAQVFDRTLYTTIADAIGTPAISLPLNQSKLGMPLQASFLTAFGNVATPVAIAAQLEGAHP
jgi:amidase